MVAEAAVIRFTLVGCDLGRLAVAATPRGVCGVALAGADAELEAWLREEFPAADLRRADAELADHARAVCGHLSGDPADVPLDARGTAFQQRVWDELRKIPPGETRTYTQVAASLGRPAAVRAVARACATNPVSVLTPCHRVVGADGAMRGYRWGVDRKRRMLERERGR